MLLYVASARCVELMFTQYLGKKMFTTGILIYQTQLPRETLATAHDYRESNDLTDDYLSDFASLA